MQNIKDHRFLNERGHVCMVYVEFTRGETSKFDITFIEPRGDGVSGSNYKQYFKDIKDGIQLKWDVSYPQQSVAITTNLIKSNIQGNDQICYIWSYFSVLLFILNRGITLNDISTLFISQKTRYLLIYMFMYMIYMNS